MYLTFICVSAVFLFLLALCLKQIADLRTLIVETLLYPTNVEIFSDSETMSEEEIALAERIEQRDREFEARITKLKDELASTTSLQQSHTTADELHPLVKNLPHDSVQTYETNPPDVEIAE